MTSFTHTTLLHYSSKNILFFILFTDTQLSRKIQRLQEQIRESRLQRGGNNIKSPREKKLEEELLRLTSPPQQPHLLLKKVDNKLPDLSPPSKTSNTNINTTIRSSPSTNIEKDKDGK